MAYDDYAAEAQREADAYRAAVAALRPAQRAAWNTILEYNEFFDGEDAIAHGTLDGMLSRGDLISRAKAADKVMAGWGR